MVELLPMAFLKALGWSLLHSLWQMGILSGCYYLLTQKGRAWSPRIRHNLALLFSITGAAVFFGTLGWEYSHSDSSLLGSVFIPEASFIQYSQLSTQVLPFLSSLYLLSIVFLFIRFIRQFQVTRQLRQGPSVKAPIELRLFLKDMSGRLGIRKKIEIRLSEWISTPFTTGFWKPIIILPVALLNHLNLQQAESILLHELHHIRRNDYLINLFIASLDILLFFNPFSRFFTSTLIRERENDCDDMVLQFRYQPADYATALLLLEQQRLKPLPVFSLPATGFNKKMLLQRIQRILYGRTLPQQLSPRIAGLLLFTLLISGVSLLKAIPASENSPLTNTKTQVSIPATVATVAGSLKTIKGIPLPETEIVTKGITTTTQQKESAEPLHFASLILDLKRQMELEEAAAVKENLAAKEFAAIADDRDYSLTETNQKDASITTVPAEVRVEPYIPAYSFNYQTIQDSSSPKGSSPATIGQASNEDLTKTLKALEAIDWKALEKQLKDNKNNLDIVRLQLELKKAVAAVDWKKIQSESMTAIQSEAEELLLKNAYQKQLENYKNQEKLKKEYEDKVKLMILNDRLNQQNSVIEQREKAKAPAYPIKKVRKVVVI